MTALLAYHNTLIQLRCPELPSTLRAHWLWGLDLKEDVSVRQMLNEAHLTGLVLCRTSALEKCVIQVNDYRLQFVLKMIINPYFQTNRQLIK
jgi:hypothetical protein